MIRKLVLPSLLSLALPAGAAFLPATVETTGVASPGTGSTAKKNSAASTAGSAAAGISPVRSSVSPHATSPAAFVETAVLSQASDSEPSAANVPETAETCRPASRAAATGPPHAPVAGSRGIATGCDERWSSSGSTQTSASAPSAPRTGRAVPDTSPSQSTRASAAAAVPSAIRSRSVPASVHSAKAVPSASSRATGEPASARPDASATGALHAPPRHVAAETAKSPDVSVSASASQAQTIFATVPS